MFAYNSVVSCLACSQERQAFGTMWICKSDNRLTADIKQNALYEKGFPLGAISHFSVIKKAYVSHSSIFYYYVVYYILFILYNYSNMYCTITVMWTMGCAKNTYLYILHTIKHIILGVDTGRVALQKVWATLYVQEYLI